jgi:hypothetical protein
VDRDRHVVIRVIRGFPSLFVFEILRVFVVIPISTSHQGQARIQFSVNCQQYARERGENVIGFCD